jgi:adenylate cyclase
MRVTGITVVASRVVGEDVRRAMSQSQAQTFLFADLAGFTALTEAHGDEEAADLAAEFCDWVRELLADHGAEEVKTLGDAMMIRVDEPAFAIELGLRIVEEVGARPRFPIVRVGMHTGPAVERSGDWFGSTVNVAARIAAAAAGNDVLLSEATRETAGKPDGVDLERHGEHRFKNVNEPVIVYRAVRQGKEGEEMPIDPVCQMAVEPGESAGQLRHQGKTYFFCSFACAEKFAREPRSYV